MQSDSFDKMKKIYVFLDKKKNITLSMHSFEYVTFMMPNPCLLFIQPTDRLKTEEELAKEEKERLEKQEVN